VNFDAKLTPRAPARVVYVPSNEASEGCYCKPPVFPINWVRFAKT